MAGTVVARLAALKARKQSELRTRHPALFPNPALLPAPLDRTAVVLGRDQQGSPVSLPLRTRLAHCLVTGTTGSGKTKYFEHTAWQDILDGRGVVYVDPHGNHPDSGYRSLLSRIDERGL